MFNFLKDKKKEKFYYCFEPPIRPSEYVKCIEGRKIEMNKNITINMENLSENERKQLLELINKSNRYKQYSNIFNPNETDSCYFIDPDGEILKGCYVKTILETRKNNCNICTDKTYLEKLAKRQLLDRMLWKYVWENNQLDKDKIYDHNINFSIWYDISDDSWHVTTNSWYSVNLSPIFYNKDVALAAIEEVIIPFENKYGKYRDLIF